MAADQAVVGRDQDDARERAPCSERHRHPAAEAATAARPSHFFKCILAEDKKGNLKMWAFEMENASPAKALSDYQVTTSYIEQRAGIDLWGNLTGPEVEREKTKKRAMWKY